MREWMSEVANVLAGAVKHPSGMTYCPQVLELSRPTSIGDMMSESRNAVRRYPKSSDPIREGHNNSSNGYTRRCWEITDVVGRSQL